VQVIGNSTIQLEKGGKTSGSLFVILDETHPNTRQIPVVIGIFNEGERVDEVQTNFLGE
jgi:hypothetical protein